MDRIVWSCKGLIVAAVVMFCTMSVFPDGVQNLDAPRVKLLQGSPFYEWQELHRTGYVGQLAPAAGKILTALPAANAAVPE